MSYSEGSYSTSAYSASSGIVASPYPAGTVFDSVQETVLLSFTSDAGVGGAGGFLAGAHSVTLSFSATLTLVAGTGGNLPTRPTKWEEELGLGSVWTPEDPIDGV